MNRILAAGALALASAVVSSATSPSPATLLADINTTLGGNNSSAPSSGALLGNKVVFNATDYANGAELWITDGTEAGTQLLREIVPGQTSSGPNKQFSWNGEVYFTAFSPNWGTELWKTDGTAAGTILLKDGSPGAGGTFGADYFTPFAGALYYTAQDSAGGIELWKTDGTQSGTVQVKDIFPGQSGGAPANITVAGSTMFFRATGDATTGIALWKSDGSSAGTVQVKDLIPGGTLSPFTTTFVAAGNSVVFGANDNTSTSGDEIWVSDGTSAGTVLLKDILPGATGSSPRELTAMGGAVYFSASDSSGNNELWRTDGTSAGTVKVTEINPTAGSFPKNLFAFNGKVYFGADDGSGGGEELWASDGTSAGTVKVKELNSGAGSGSPAEYFTFNGALYFTANDATFGRELFVTDGTTAGTTLVADINPGVSQSTVRALAQLSSTQMLLRADDGVHGVELWMLDGSGVRQVKDINLPRAASFPRDLVTLGSQVLFPATAGSADRELYRSDGTEAGTALIADVQPGAQSSIGGKPVIFGNQAIYFGYVTGSGKSLIKTDGTAAATGPYVTLAGDSYSGPDAIVPSGTLAFFNNSDSTYGNELWKTDGTAAGTALVKDIYPGNTVGIPFDSFPQPIAAGAAGMVFFGARDGVNGRELWKSDGTLAGTVLVKDILAGAGDGGPNNFAWNGSVMFFSASDSSFNNELWKSDGTTAGTVRVKDINTNTNGSSFPGFLTAMGSTVYFSAQGTAGDRELWKTDGTDAGTVQVKDIFAGLGSSNPQDLVAMDGTLYFTALDGLSGRSLWKSDGTDAGTVKVIDTCPGMCDDAAGNLRVIAGQGLLMFAAYDDGAGYEPWVTDGTMAGTHRVADINPGVGGSTPQLFTRAGSNVVFAATGPNDDEPYGISLAALYDSEPDAFSFASQPNVTPGATVTSNTITVTGIEVPSAISVSGGEYSIGCTSTFTTNDATVVAGDTVCVRHVASNSYDTPTTTTLYIGGVSGFFQSTTIPADTTPNAFNFTTQTGVARSTVITSNAASISGINSAAAISVSSGEYRIDGGSWVSSAGTIANGQSVDVRHTSSGSFSTDTVTTLTIGGVAGTFTSTTMAADTTPDAFSFASQAGVTPGATIVSDAVTVAGINTSAPVSVTGGEYRVAGGAWGSSAGNIANGQTVEVRHTAASAFSTDTVTTLTIGGVSGTFTSTTVAADTLPDAFAFTPQTGVARSTAVTSNAITVSGLNTMAAVGVSNGEYRIDGGPWVSTAGNVVNGNTVELRHTSAAAYSTAKTTMLTIGGFSAGFTSTTLAEPPVPPAAGGGGAMSLNQLLTLLVMSLSVWAARRRAARKVSGTA